MTKKGKFIYLLLFGIFLVVGIGLLTGGSIMLVNNAEFKKKAEEVSARITYIESYWDSDNDLKHRVYVDYTYGGKEYTGVKLNFYSSSMYEGKEIVILCDPMNPEKIQFKNGLYFAGILLIFIGAIFTLVSIASIVPILLLFRKSGQKKKLIASGKQLHATVEQITVNTSYTVNGRHPYVIYCSYRDEYRDVIYRFKSESLWTDPNLVFKTGDTIRIYVDEKNYSHYHVDAESVLNGKVIDYT